ncbi:hypothetical protein H2200_012412 [Cladophialophora chaetospira]|uniref:Thioesterase domain-containing protein n=1 Tax=Cladophialophora chaetospira TaxID=386627 RepID=A0AA38WXV7_9EURO|nr:hypothetical protein H2200_012412 [Cladophialophora chaetospira]
MSLHPDFQSVPCQKLLNGEDIKILETHTGQLSDSEKTLVDSVFLQTFYRADGIRAQITFERVTSEPDAILRWEHCFLMSLGPGLDGKAGRAHGGFIASIMDHIAGSVAVRVSRSHYPPTANLIVDYAAPVNTPRVVLCRAWAVERSGRKTLVRGCIEDADGLVLARGRALFIDQKPEKI